MKELVIINEKLEELEYAYRIEPNEEYAKALKDKIDDIKESMRDTKLDELRQDIADDESMSVDTSELVTAFVEKKVEFLETLDKEDLEEYLYSTGSELNIEDYK